MPDETISIEHIVTTYMVKYNRLGILINKAFAGSKDTKINIFIDLYGLYKTILSRSYRTDISDYMAIVPAIINMCAHYRQFFKQLGVYATIYLISSYNVNEICTKLVAGYNKTMVDKLQNPPIRDMLEFNLNLLEILCPYLQGIYYVKTEFESSVVMDQILQKPELQVDPSIIISSDILPVQLCAKYPKCSFIRAKKYRGEDLSKIIVPSYISESDFIVSFNDVVYGDMPNSSSAAYNYHVSPSNLILLLALNGFPQRNIRTILNASIATKEIISTNNTFGMNVDLFYKIKETINPESVSRLPAQEIIDSRYKALSVEFFDDIFKDSIEYAELNFVDLIDPAAIQLINSKYFSNNPIDVFRL